MAKIVSICPVCQKKGVEELSLKIWGKTAFHKLDCGHTYTSKVIEKSKLNTIKLNDGRELYPFQVEGVRFLEGNSFRGLITDEMGLGKTIQAIGALKLHSDELLPVLVIVKASLTVQWAKEIYNGTGLPAQILDTKTPPLENFPIYITSFDSLPGRATKNGTSNGVGSKLRGLKLKTLIIDECQMMKNHDSNRTNAIRELMRETITVKNTPLPKSEYTKRLKRAEMIAENLMEYHGVKNRFKLTFDKTNPKILGYCECKSLKQDEGRITGRINLSAQFIETASDDQVIEIVLHEIAHAITPGAGHRDIWRDTAIAIGSDGNRVYDWCNGTIEPLPEERTEPSIKYIIALSGTPIKNNAIEYFPILNLLHPERFPNRQRFIDREVRYYYSGNSYKPGGLAYPEQFQEKTKDFIIRRTRKEVLPDLPKIQRDYKLFEMGVMVKEAYNKKVKQLSDFLDKSESEGVKSFELQTGILGYLNMLRHITGLAKVEPVIEYIDEFLQSENGSGEKITIFHHHIDVGDVLSIKLEELFPGSTIRIVSADDSSKRQEKIDEFRTNPEKRILIAPTLACGEGINLQFCSHSIIMEREWNPANEEQAEGRFSRIGSVAEKILVNYPTGTGTIDEFLTEMVERKRQYVNEALDGSAGKWEESDIIRELASKVVAKWRLQ